jgi:hypothetical protein
MFDTETANLLQIAAYLETGEPSFNAIEERLCQLHDERMELLEALRRISLASKNSMSDRHELGKIARQAIAKAEGA